MPILKIILITSIAFFVSGYSLLKYFVLVPAPNPNKTQNSGTLTPEELESSKRLKTDVYYFCNIIGQRDYQHPKNLNEASNKLAQEFTNLGYQVSKQLVPTPDYLKHKKDGELPLTFFNVIAEKRGNKSPDEIIVIGAHYDTCAGTETPGADDNTSGTAGLLELAKLLAKETLNKTIRFVAFVNEEPPFFHTPYMGSRFYARSCKEKDENIVAMLCLEMIGYYSNEPNSQSYPPPIGPILSMIYPDKGNFIAFIGNLKSRDLLLKSINSFRENSDFPSEGVSLPEWVTGVDWSDHSSFWVEGYPAIMISDTSLFRNPHYHKPSDTPETLDYQSMARVIQGVKNIVLDLQ
jgi:hypothetical protein